MDWFTPERRLATYRLVAALIALAVALNVATTEQADAALVAASQVLDAIAGVAGVLATLLAAHNVPRPGAK